MRETAPACALVQTTAACRSGSAGRLRASAAVLALG